jgi:hypothetical protein
MTTEALSVTTTGSAADAVFAVLADPAGPAAVDGTGWVCEPLDGERPTKSGQAFPHGRRRIRRDRHRGGWQTCLDNLERMLAGRPPGGRGMRPPNIHSGSAAMGAEERLRATR